MMDAASQKSYTSDILMVTGSKSVTMDPVSHSGNLTEARSKHLNPE